VEEKGQGSISEWDLSGDLKFRIPSEPKGPSANSFHSVAPESLRAKQNQDEKIAERKISRREFHSNRDIFYLVYYSTNYVNLFSLKTIDCNLVLIIGDVKFFILERKNKLINKIKKKNYRYRDRCRNRHFKFTAVSNS
jgi:hypothetical protein